MQFAGLIRVHLAAYDAPRAEVCAGLGLQTFAYKAEFTYGRIRNVQIKHYIIRSIRKVSLFLCALYERVLIM